MFWSKKRAAKADMTFGQTSAKADIPFRQTFGIVDRIESNGFGVVRELHSNKPGFFTNETLVDGSLAAVYPGARVHLGVEDKNELLVVRSIDAIV